MFVKISSNKNIFFFNVHIYYCAPHVPPHNIIQDTMSEVLFIIETGQRDINSGPLYHYCNLLKVEKSSPGFRP